MRTSGNASTLGYSDLDLGESSYHFSVATGDDLDAARLLRVVRYAPRFPGSDPWYLDNDRDQDGKVFLMRRDGRAVATLRLLPVSGGNPELPLLRPLPAELAQADGTWELGRVAALDAPPDHPPYMPLLFGWAARWAGSHLALERVVAYCRGGRLRSFTRFGARAVDGPYTVPGKGDDYYTVSVELRTALHALGELGVTGFPEPAQPA